MVEKDLPKRSWVMAIISDFVCRQCGNNRTESHSVRSGPPEICSYCVEKNENEDRVTHLKGRSVMSIEERLARIESDIYDLTQQNQRPQWDGLIG